MDKYEKLRASLSEDLYLIDKNLVDWNVNYFKDHWKRFKSDLRIVEKYYQGGEILEVGSLPCHLTYCLKSLGYPVTGLDIDPERASAFIKKHNLKIYKCNFETERIPFDDRTFSFILFNEVFEHLRIDPISTLKELNRVLKPNGVMMLSTPNLNSTYKKMRVMMGKGFDDPFIEFHKLHHLGHMGHVRVYTKNQVVKFLKNTGFHPVEVEYRTYNKIRGKASFINMLDRFIPQGRAFQIIISKKS